MSRRWNAPMAPRCRIGKSGVEPAAGAVASRSLISRSNRASTNALHPGFVSETGFGFMRDFDTHYCSPYAFRLAQSLHIRGTGCRRFPVALEHCRGDFLAARPLAAPLSGMGLIVRQASGVVLYHAAVFQEEQAHFFGRHTGDEVLGFVERGAQPRGDVLGINRLGTQ